MTATETGALFISPLYGLELGVAVSSLVLVFVTVFTLDASALFRSCVCLEDCLTEVGYRYQCGSSSSGNREAAVGTGDKTCSTLRDEGWQ